MRSQTRVMGFLLAGFGWFAARDVVAALVMWSCSWDAGGSPEPEHRSRHKISGAYFRLGSGARRARRRVLHPSRVERRPPALLVVASELEIIALVRHPDRDPADAGPRAQPGAERVERARSCEGREHPAKPSAAASSRPRWSLMGHWEGRRPRAREAAALCGQPRRGIAGPVAGSPRWRSCT